MDEEDSSELLLQIDRQPFVDAERRVNMRFTVDGDFVRYLFDQGGGPDWKEREAYQLEQTITRPTAIFRGLRRQGFDDAICYLGNIRGDDTNSTGFVFVAFAACRKNDICVFDWEPRVANPFRRDYPNNWRDDFGEQLWPN